MVPRIESQVPLNLFPCKNCPLIVSQKYPNRDLKLKESAAPNDTLLILREGKIIKEEIVKKMIPGCRFCEGYYHHAIGH